MSSDNAALLFGHDNRKGIVAIEPAGRFVRLFFRTSNGVHFHDEPFRPFILVNNPDILGGISVPFSVRSLTGSEQLGYQISFDSWSDCLTARDQLSSSRKNGRHKSHLFLTDPMHQYLLSSGATFFKGMDMAELRCLFIDIETYCSAGHLFPNPDRPEDRIISIACKDSHGSEIILKGHELSEAEILTRLNEIIQQSDPDVICGHNIFRFDLNYIGKRARRHNIQLNWGRNGSAPRVNKDSRWILAERSIDYPRWDIYGRQIIDTYFLVQHYDIARRCLDSHGLKSVAQHFGVAAANRVYLEGDKISEQFDSDPERLYRYNLDDVRETAAIFNILAYPWFLQSRIFPFSFQNCPLRGTATRINSLMVRQYLHQGHSLPMAPLTTSERHFEGGYTDIFQSGICGPIVHCDVASLYPSLMLIYRLKPANDTLDIFLPMLSELCCFRLKAKQLAQNAGQMQQRLYYESLQQLFKTVINSFFGYLGSSIHNFSDPATAAEITRLGRVTIRNMLELLEREGAKPVEIDTDGIYFVPAEGCQTEEAQRALIERVSAALPNGINVEMDGRYRSIFAYKAKNYALLGYDDKITLKGSSLRSRGMEPYLREFMQQAIRMLLTSSADRIEGLFLDFKLRLTARKFAIEWVSKRETLNDSPEQYRAKVRAESRNRSAAFEIACQNPGVYQAGDQVSYYISGTVKDAIAYENCRATSSFDPARPDINIPYYIEKLKHLKKRFEPFLPQEKTLFD